MVSEASRVEPLTGGPWNVRVVVVATVRNTAGSRVGYAMGAHGGRTFIAVPAGVARMPPGRFIVYSTLGAFPWSLGLECAGEQPGSHWTEIPHALSRSTGRSRWP